MNKLIDNALISKKDKNFFQFRRNGTGTHFGTFGGIIPAFDPVTRAQKKPKTSKRNIMTSPAKKGTGYGSVDMSCCIP